MWDKRYKQLVTRFGDRMLVKLKYEDLPFFAFPVGTGPLAPAVRELHAFASVRDFASRAYARVLPMEDSLRACREAGLPPAHILAMQGPFSRELNAAMLRSIGAAYLVTKASGSAGGLCFCDLDLTFVNLLLIFPTLLAFYPPRAYH